MSAIQQRLAETASAPQNFTARSVIAGCLIGTIVVFSNMYFGLQTGWISGMNMPSALLGFAAFRGWDALFPADPNQRSIAGSGRLRRLLRQKFPFTPVENVLLQSVSGSVGTMPLGCGFVGVIVALEKLMRKEADGIGPIDIALWRLIVWAVGICLFGVVFAVPLREQVIIREKLKFPTGTATALMIGVLHGEKSSTIPYDSSGQSARSEQRQSDEDEPLDATASPANESSSGLSHLSDWKSNIRNLGLAVLFSAIYTVFSYFVPQIHNLPIFGTALATKWLWTFNPSPAYIAQGIIMGPSTTLHMLLGAVVGWAILSPVAKTRGWAPGAIDDWTTGSKGWIMWISLAIMLADSITSLLWLILQPSGYYLRHYGVIVIHRVRNGQWKELAHELRTPPSELQGYAPVSQVSSRTPLMDDGQDEPTSSAAKQPDYDAPPEHLIQTREFCGWFILSTILYFVSIHVAFPRMLPFGLDIVALLLATLLSVMGVRALGSTDLNPVSGISKLTQLIFAALAPGGSLVAVPMNMVAGAISESGALQSGDLMQDLKTGHLLGAAPNAQFYGQLIGSVFGAIVSAIVYKLYTSVYEIPGGQFQVPSGFMWLFTAELVTGKGLPELAGPFAVTAAAIFIPLTALRIAGEGKPWLAFVPGGIAVAVGMYNTPSFTLARTLGGLGSWWWTKRRGGSESSVVILASGLILGEGLTSILNLGLEALGVPHL